MLKWGVKAEGLQLNGNADLDKYEKAELPWSGHTATQDRDVVLVEGFQYLLY